MDLERGQVLAYRARRHGLAERRPRDELADALHTVGLRRTKLATISLVARLDAVEPDDLSVALRSGQVVAFYGARGTVMMAPPADVPALSVGTAPSDDASLRAALPGAFLRHLDAGGLKATDALRTVMDAVHRVLAGGPLPRGETAQAVTRAVPRALAPPCRGRCPDPHVEDSLFRLAGVNGIMRFAGDDDVLVGTGPVAEAARPALRADFLRRYLSCYGPSEAATLAAWAGIGAADARRSLDALGDEAVDLGGKRLMLAADAPAAVTRDTSDVEGVRLLPPFDPYLLDRDRDLLVPDRATQKSVWRASGNPGVVLVDGEPVATWRRNTKAGPAGIAVQPLGAAPPLDPAEYEDEAARLFGL